MATRALPGVYTSLNDLSQIPEGPTSLVVGYVLAANKGPVNTPTLVISPTDFLNQFSYLGKPGIGEDPTYWDILKVLNQTNQMYVTRAVANDAKYGAMKVVSQDSLGTVVSITENDSEYIITVDVKNADTKGNSILLLKGTTINPKKFDGLYTVDNTKTEFVGNDTVFYCPKETGDTSTFRGTAQYRFNVDKFEDIETIIESPDPYGEDEIIHTYIITAQGNLTSTISVGSVFVVIDCPVTQNNKEYTVKSLEYDETLNQTTVYVEESVVEAESGYIWTDTMPTLQDAPQQPYHNMGIDEEWNPTGDTTTSFLITGKDPGAYNGDLEIRIESSVDNPEAFVYHKGADIGQAQPCSFDTILLQVYSKKENILLENFTFTKTVGAKTIDGQSLFIDDVVKGSNYIRVINNPNTTALPATCTQGITLTSGDNGGEVTEIVLVTALNGFLDKTVPISILACGSSTAQESKTFQQALMEVAVTRKDLVAFLNSRRQDEKYALASERVTNMVTFKKNELSSVSFYGTMYAPHVNSTDTINQRQVNLGAASTAVAGWLNVINTLSYPYAYAGPQNGQVLGVTCEWKIGDASGEAQLLNDASINYVAFDAKVGRYYMQCQNTLQIANSSLRNLGAVLNVLDIKEHFQTSLKEYLQLPITTSLRRDIINTARDYLDPMTGIRFHNYSFQDVSSDIDLADGTLRYLLTLNPTPYAQKIYLVMNIVNANFDFAILQSM